MSKYVVVVTAAAIGLAGSLLPLSAFGTVSTGSDRAVQQLNQGMLLAAAAKKKVTKAKTKAKAKTPAAKSKTQDRGTVSTPLTPGEYR